MFDTTYRQIARADQFDAPAQSVQTGRDWLHIVQTSLPVPTRPSVLGFAHDVARRRGDVTVEEIFSPRRGQRITTARQEVWWHAKKAGWSYPRIGMRFKKPGTKKGHVDHTTVIWGVAQHEKLIRARKLAIVAADNATHARAHGGRS